MKDDNRHLVDQLLVMDAQDGDRRAMQKLVQRWQKRLWLHARRLTGDGQAAWDVTQEARLAVIKGIGRLHDPARFKPWAYRIVTNKAMDLLKARQAGRPRGRQPASRAAYAEPAAGGEQTHLPVAELLGRLDAGKRAAVALYYLEGLSVAEVGSVLNIPPGTVKSRLHNARIELKRLCGRDLE